MDRHYQGKHVSCPVDVTALRSFPDGASVFFQCNRCGEAHEGDALHRIGTNPLKIAEDESSPVEDVVINLPALLADYFVPRAELSSLSVNHGMEKRYQVFVSSTFDDLKEERQHVTRALQAMQCIPAGMELFPASNDDQWTVIKKVIDDCDYYLMILGGRYGSQDDEGIGYTEKEFDYAIGKGIPVICFLHKNPGSLIYDRTEQEPEGRKKLEAFRKKARKGRLVQFWESPYDLAAKVSTSMHALFKSNPREGWVKGCFAVNPGELERLRSRIAELESRLEDNGAGLVASTAGLSQEALTILKEADRSISKRIMVTGADQGFEIHSGNLIVSEVGNHRVYATYRAAIEDLLNHDFIHELSEGLFEPTAAGYNVLDNARTDA